MNPYLCLNFAIFLFALAGCGNADHQAPKKTKTIQGRNDPIYSQNVKRFPVYQAIVPSPWLCIEPSETQSNADTTLPLCEWIIGEGADKISIVVHNFPSDDWHERIPPQAQLARWKRQLEPLKEGDYQIKPEAYGGFSGFSFEAQGNLKGQPVIVLGWAMQIGPDYYRILKRPAPSQTSAINKQKRADYTIKAVGPPESMLQHRTEIIAFANSFGLIEELPEE